MRRADTEMSDQDTKALLERGFVGRLATIGENGWPYVIPILYVVMDNEIWFHHTMAKGRLTDNLAFSQRVCFEVDEPYEVFRSGATACATSLACQSAVVFGRMREMKDEELKRRVFDLFMQKYASQLGDIPEYGPTFAKTALYAMTMSVVTGKQKTDPRRTPEVK